MIKEALSSLPTSLDAAYDEVIGRMKDQERKAAAFRVMSWIFHAGRALQMKELCEALVIQEGNKQVDEESIQGPDSIIELCESLLVWDQSTDYVTFAHYTVQEYLTSACSSQLLPSSTISKMCLTYLASDLFESPLPEDELEFGKWLSSHPFSNYAVNFWHSHFNEGENLNGLLFRSVGLATRRHDFARIEKAYTWWSDDMSSPFLHILVKFGLERACHDFLSNMEEYYLALSH